MLLLIMAAQLLIPLLHSHFGSPNQAGLHVHALPSRAALSEVRVQTPASAAVDTHGHPAALKIGEPFEVDVQDALQPLDQLPLPLLAAAGLALLTLGLQAARMRCIASRPSPRAAPERPNPRGRVVRPSPARAPPLFS